MTAAPDAGRAGWDARLIADLAVVLALVVWWQAAQGLPDFVLPSPLAVGERLVGFVTDWELAGHAWQSAWRVAASVVLAVALGFALALMAYLFPITEVIVHQRILTFFNSFPSVGWAVLAVLWFEMSNLTVIFVQVAILVPFALINIGEGLRQMDEDLLEMGRSFTRKRRRVLIRLMLPMVLPYLVAAARIAYGIGWKVALVSELFGAPSGLGYLLMQAQVTADAAMIFACCLAIVFLFVAGERLVITPVARRYGV